MRRIITLTLLFIIALAFLGVGSTLVRRSQISSVSAPDQTLTSEYLLNGGYPFGHPTGLPGDAIAHNMTLTATVRVGDTVRVTNAPLQTAIAFATDHAAAPGDLTFNPGQTNMTYHVTFTEQEMNALLPQYVPADANIQAIEFHFTEAGVNLTATAKTFGLTINASAAAQITIQAGAITLDVQEATVAGLRPPQAAINAVMDQIVTLIGEAINGALEQYTDGDPHTLTAITTSQGAITIAFALPTPQPE